MSDCINRRYNIGYIEVGVVFTMDKYSLSICIPTYNGNQRVLNHLKRILVSKRTDIEVVVTDNCSTDGTYELIKMLTDERLKVYRNQENLGAMGNGIEALSKGTGRYLMLLLDRDILQIDFLDAYVEFLNSIDEGVILNMCQHLGKSDIEHLGVGQSVYYLCEAPHPSYFTFKRDAFKTVNICEEILGNGYYPALIGFYIMKNNSVILNREIPIILEAEIPYILMNSSRTWKYLSTQDSIIKEHSFELENDVCRTIRYLEYASQQAGLELDEEFIIGIYTAMVENVMKYFNFMHSPITRHRYPYGEHNYSLEEYGNLAYMFQGEILEYLKRKGRLSETIQENINLITEKCALIFTNDNISLVQTDFIKNKKRIDEINNILEERGRAYGTSRKNKDIIYREGINTDTAE